MPLLSLVLTNTTRNSSTGLLDDATNNTPYQIELFGAIAKQPIVLTSYFIEFSEELPDPKKFALRLPFLNDFDCNTNNNIKASIPIFCDAGRATYRECDYEFNIARNISQNMSDMQLYFSSTDTPVNMALGYEITLNFTYRRPELI